MVQCGLRCRAGTGVRAHEDCCRMRDPDLEKARHDAPARESPASRSDLLIVITDQTMTGRTHFTRLLLYSSSHASTPIFREFSITYKYLGTAQVENGLGRWTFNWTAPAKSNGRITFYFGGIAANNDGTDSGDWVYHQKTTISPAN